MFIYSEFYCFLYIHIDKKQYCYISDIHQKEHRAAAQGREELWKKTKAYWTQ